MSLVHTLFSDGDKVILTYRRTDGGRKALYGTLKHNRARNSVIIKVGTLEYEVWDEDIVNIRHAI